MPHNARLKKNRPKTKLVIPADLRKKIEKLLGGKITPENLGRFFKTPPKAKVKPKPRSNVSPKGASLPEGIVERLLRQVGSGSGENTTPPSSFGEPFIGEQFINRPGLQPFFGGTPEGVNPFLPFQGPVPNLPNVTNRMQGIIPPRIDRNIIDRLLLREVLGPL